ncbi:gas vesicle protein GvpJ [Halorussus sp. GCM10023401]|uniref:gas vesicle protein GvpJ n=1 Tax=Halorussus TaxID=1070314 RepID=UPI003614E437
MDETRPTRRQSDLADVVELLLDKGVVINADIAVTVGETELLGVKLRAAVASFETAAQYGMEFPDGTDVDRVEHAAGVEPLEDGPGEQVELDELEVESPAADDPEDERDDD